MWEALTEKLSLRSSHWCIALRWRASRIHSLDLQRESGYLKVAKRPAVWRNYKLIFKADQGDQSEREMKPLPNEGLKAERRPGAVMHCRLTLFRLFQKAPEQLLMFFGVLYERRLYRKPLQCRLWTCCVCGVLCMNSCVDFYVDSCIWILVDAAQPPSQPGSSSKSAERFHPKIKISVSKRLAANAIKV